MKSLRVKPPMCSRLTCIARMYRAEWPSIPRSVLSTLLTTLVMCRLLAIDEIRHLLEGAGHVLASAACTILYNLLWYGAFRVTTELQAAWRIGFSPAAVAAFERRETEQQRRWFLSYFVAFNVLQFIAGALMLEADLSPAAAQAWNSAVGNILWLAALPVARALIRECSLTEG